MTTKDKRKYKIELLTMRNGWRPVRVWCDARKGMYTYEADTYAQAFFTERRLAKDTPQYKTRIVRG